MQPRLVTRLLKDESGAVAIMLGLLMLPLLGLAAMAIDFGMAVATGTRLQNALDDTAIAVAQAVRLENLSESEAQERANLLFAHYSAKNAHFGATTSGLTVDLNTATGSVEVRLDSGVHATIGTSFARVLGFNSLTAVRNSVATYSVREIELGVMLDVSGSMADGTKIQDLKSSVSDLVTTMIKGSAVQNQTKISLVPYSYAVNAGPFASVVTAGASAACVTERTGSKAFTDDSPTGIDALGAKAAACPPNAVLPLTADKNQLLTYVNGLVPDGSTAGHLGTAWAWYTISPEWNAVWPPGSAAKPYGAGGTIKAVILMTDGIYNTAYEPGNGDSIQQALALCAAMKLKDVVVYTVAFDAPAAAVATLEACASTPSRAFVASNGSALREAFRAIADEMTSIRLSK